MNIPLLRDLRKAIKILTVFFTILLSASPSYSADVIILGNTRLKPVSEVINGIKETLHHKEVIISIEDINNDLADIVRDEGANTVIALGKDALTAAGSLTESISVIYGLLITPPETERKNITGVYMTTPVIKYLSLLNTYFPEIKKIAVICMHGVNAHIQFSIKSPSVTYCNAKNPYEFIESLTTMGKDIDALLLLPERDLITARVLERLYIFSFRENIPILGISEKYVKTGSLFSLGFDTSAMGQQIGKLANKVITNKSAAGLLAVPPDNFHLYINRKTSETMNINIPPELAKIARKVYP